MIRRLAVLVAALTAVGILGAPGAQADERLQLENPMVLCVIVPSLDRAVCVDRPY